MRSQYDACLIGKSDEEQWLYSAQADLHRRLGQAPEAQAAYQKALSMSQQEPERRRGGSRRSKKNGLDVCRIWGPPND